MPATLSKPSDAQLSVLCHRQSPGEYVVGSAHNVDLAYRVNSRFGRCTCEAAEHGSACWHVRVARLVEQTYKWIDPEPKRLPPVSFDDFLI